MRLKSRGCLAVEKSRRKKEKVNIIFTKEQAKKMLREKIFRTDELPVSVITANIVDYPFHFHDDMEIVYVLSGSII